MFTRKPLRERLTNRLGSTTVTIIEIVNYIFLMIGAAGKFIFAVLFVWFGVLALGWRMEGMVINPDKGVKDWVVALSFIAIIVICHIVHMFTLSLYEQFRDEKEDENHQLEDRETFIKRVLKKHSRATARAVQHRRPF